MRDPLGSVGPSSMMVCRRWMASRKSTPLCYGAESAGRSLETTFQKRKREVKVIQRTFGTRDTGQTRAHGRAPAHRFPKCKQRKVEEVYAAFLEIKAWKLRQRPVKVTSTVASCSGATHIVVQQGNVLVHAFSSSCMSTSNPCVTYHTLI